MGSEPARISTEGMAPANNGWVNLLPRWILEGARFQELKPQQRAGLQDMANAGQRHPSGEITGIVGGEPLYTRMSCSKRTFFRWLKTFEACGFVVLLRRGGGMAYLNGENLANAYGIPHKLGSLQHCQRFHRTQHMVRRATDTGETRWIPVSSLPGDQQELPFSDGSTNHTLVSGWHGGSVKMTRGPCHPDTGIHNSLHNSLHNKTKPAGFCAEGHVGRSRIRKRRHWQITETQLRDTESLLELYGQMLASEPCLPGVQGGEAGQLRFVGYAEHALRIATRNPPGLFYAMLRDDPDRDHRRITGRDEDAAHQRLREYLYPEDQRRNEGPSVVEPAAPDVTEVSRDAQFVSKATNWVAINGHRGDAFDLVRARDPLWTRERWDRAIQELDHAGGVL